MHIGLVDVDSHSKFPNLALMKLSAYHKANGDTVEWASALVNYDKIYMSKVFDDTYTKDDLTCYQAKEIIRGGTGYDLHNKLPDEIEHIYPDYSLYGIEDVAYGYLTRGCPRHCDFCIVGDKEGLTSTKVADLTEFWNGQKSIKLLDPNLLACKDSNELLEQLAESKSWIDITQGLDMRLMTYDKVELLNKLKFHYMHFAWDNPKDMATLKHLEKFRGMLRYKNASSYVVYVLVNFNSTLDEDLFRIYKLREIGYLPYVMCYDKPNAPQVIRKLQRWCNNRWIYKSCDNFNDYWKNEK